LGVRAVEAKMAQVAMSPELSAWVADRIARFPHEAPEQLRWLAPSVVEYDALPLYVGWWDTTGIRADGEIVSWSTEDELSGYSGVRRSRIAISGYPRSWTAPGATNV
jgi:hypothetical protein